jgi:hypothetical protein
VDDDESRGPPEDNYAEHPPSEPPENIEFSTHDAENSNDDEPNPPATETPPFDNQQDVHPIPRNKSIAHWYYVENDLVFVSFDIETGGTYCGIVQISAEMFRLVHDPSAQQNTPPTLIHLETTFNEYVNHGASAIWDPACSRIHGLTAESPEIQAADGIGLVWRRFCDWVNDHFLTTIPAS